MTILDVRLNKIIAPRVPGLVHSPQTKHRLSSWLHWEEMVMDKDRIAGAAKEIKGSVKETIGKAVGDAKLQADGRADQVEGKVQNAVGGLKDVLNGK
jgi:uncharacterized protein YjbJ (UPF0337 family)